MDLTTAVTFSILLWDFWHLDREKSEVAEGQRWDRNKEVNFNHGDLGGGFKYFLFSPLLGPKIPNLTDIFSDGLKPSTRDVLHIQMNKRPSGNSFCHDIFTTRSVFFGIQN